jgi:hypothetical protein
MATTIDISHNSCGTGIGPVQDWLFRRCLIEQIVPYQDFRNWKYEVDAENDRILTGVKALNPKEAELRERLLLTLQETLSESAITLLEQGITARKLLGIS